MPESFIEVEKDGVQILVHPLVLDGHLKLGWKIVTESATATPAQPEDLKKPLSAFETAAKKAAKK